MSLLYRAQPVASGVIRHQYGVLLGVTAEIAREIALLGQGVTRRV
jgi:hypothetical protein